jgi:hypothetical protein
MNDEWRMARLLPGDMDAQANVMAFGLQPHP